MVNQIVKFFHKSHRKGIEFRNWRSFQYTRKSNSEGKAVFRLDASETTQQIDTGWDVEIWRDGKNVYTGRVYSIDEKNKIRTVFCEDKMGILAKRKFYQFPDTERETSAEVIYHLDGFDLGNGMILNTDNFITKTGTTRAWHWEYENYLNFLKVLGEESVDLTITPQLYQTWINPQGDVKFLPFGGAGFYKDLNLQKISMKKTLDNTYNNVKVTGNPIRTIPQDTDFWTETTMDMWEETGGYGYSSQMGSPADIPTGTRCLQASASSCGGVCIGLSATFKKSILNEGEPINLQNATNLHFYWRFEGAMMAFKIWIKFDGWSGHELIRTITSESVDTWYEENVDLTSLGETMGIHTEFEIYIEIIDSTHAAYDIFIDTVYMDIDIYSYTASDPESIADNGTLDYFLEEKSFTSNEECQTLAEILLAHFKDPKYSFPASINGYVEIEPNSLIEFNYKGEIIKKVATSITHYVTVTGSESMQITIEDYLKDNVDKLQEKIIAMNTANKLLIQSFKTT